MILECELAWDWLSFLSRPSLTTIFLFLSVVRLIIFYWELNQFNQNQMNRNQKFNNTKTVQIYEQASEEDGSSENQINNKEYTQFDHKKRNESSQEQEGQIVSKSDLDDPQIIINQDEYDSSDEDENRMENQKRKREQQWKNRNEEDKKMANISQEDLIKKAFEDLEKTNKRVMLMRKKNEKRMDDIQKLRMAQQPYLISTNTHFRGTTSEYSIITHDLTGKAYYHPNYSLRVPEIKLDAFISKNIKEENTANYHNQVVKFQNYAYQQRKKRRHNIE